MKSKFYQKNIVITGGSSGIGLAIAIEFAKLEARLFLLARNLNRLQEAKHVLHQQFGDKLFVQVFSIDVADKNQVKRTIDIVNQEYGGIHTIIANAGIVHVEKFATLPIEKMRQIMDVNYWGAVYSIQAAWPYLCQAQDGHIGVVSSVAGYVGIIGYSAYSPTKFAMAGLAQSLQVEAKQNGIHITIIYPPDTDTPQLAEENKNMLPELAKLKRHASILQPEVVARKFVQGMCKNKFEVFCNWQSKWIKRILAFWPSLAN